MRQTGAKLRRLAACRSAPALAVLLTVLQPAPGFAQALAQQAGRTAPPAASDQAIETALVLPRFATDQDARLSAALPRPLPPSDAALLRQILAQDRSGQHRSAAVLTERLADRTLLAPLLAERHLAAGHHATPAELQDFLTRFPNDAAAPAIYAALLRSLPWGAAMPDAPAVLALTRPGAGDLAEDAHGDAGPARAALVAGHDAAAWRLAREAFLRSRRQDGACAYVAGLAAWRRGQDAQGWFAAASLAPNAGPGLAAAGAFWAGRAAARQGRDGTAWLRRAASFPHTLHGRLALAALNQADPASSRHAILAGLASASLGDADLAALGESPAGRRMFAALQIGERGWAEQAARQIWEESQAQPGLRRALLLLAAEAHFDAFIADARASLLPGNLPGRPLQPHAGFVLAAPLVYAVARVESNFDPKAQSGAGARGLMQLMPDAAGMGDASPAHAARLLRDPARNLDMGQRYLRALAGPGQAGDDFLRVLASYNAGPNALARWHDADRADPLMFLETIPTDETRRFVQRVLSHAWAYAARFGMQAPGLNRLAAGDWPSFSEATRPAPAQALATQGLSTSPGARTTL